MSARVDQRGGRVRRCIASVLLALLVLSLPGCLEDASKKKYDYNNPLDPYTTQQSSGSVEIALIDSSGLAVLVNSSGNTISLTNWTLSSDVTGSKPYTIPTFSLSSPGFVRIWSGTTATNGNTGSNDAQNLYGSGLSWTASASKATLKNDQGQTIDECKNLDQCWSK